MGKNDQIVGPAPTRDATGAARKDVARPFDEITDIEPNT